MQRVQQAAIEAVYPETGFAPEDPRLTPVGMPLVAYAVAARAIGWANEDDALIERVLKALGHTREDYDKAGDHWTPMLKQDMAVATLYGQLFANVRRPARSSRPDTCAGHPCCGLGIWSVASSPPAASQAPTTRAASRRGL